MWTGGQYPAAPPYLLLHTHLAPRLVGFCVGAVRAVRGLYGLGSCYPCGLKNNRLRGPVVFYVWSFCKSVLFIFELLHKFFIQKLLL